MKDAEFLTWMADRLVNVYDESPMTDFVRKLRAVARVTPSDQDTEWTS